MEELNVEMHINHLADFVFKKNINNSEVSLELSGIETVKDLFFFYLDLFCKGLVMLYGTGNMVNIEEVSIEQFMVIREKMSNIGIDVKLDMESADNPIIQSLIRVDECNDGAALADYVLNIKTHDRHYKIHFDFKMPGT